MSRPPAFHRARRGVALVIVLAFLVLLSALIIAFFSSVQTDLQSSKTYASGVTVKQLAETTTNVVMGQISDATKSYEISGNPSATPPVNGSGKRLTWASQPGLIHTYGDDGIPGRSFKLYSSLNMVEDAGTDYLPVKQLDNEVPDNWPTAPALFTDLNAPVLIPESAGKIKVDDKTYTANYPILDPLGLYNADADTGVEGFSIDKARGFGTAKWTPNDSYNPTVSSNPANTANPAPMPVRWLYVLNDGTITAPDPTGTTTATWKNAPAYVTPSKDNPIVGRVAFWADDDTCKLNINTASEGVFWDRSRATSDNNSSPFGEKQLNDRVPVKGEYQRYPGHPATVSMSPVFGGLNKDLKVPAGDKLSDPEYTKSYKPYYDIAPRVHDGGTRAGTASTVSNAGGRIDPDQNRLYSSVDELLFAAPDGTDPNIPSVSPLRKPSIYLNRSQLEQAKFFLTAYNRAPDVNAFGRPRISLWQLQQEKDPSNGQDGSPARPRNSKDELLAFCSTINKNPYYFQRYSIYLRQPTNLRTAHPTQPFKQSPPPSSQSKLLDWTFNQAGKTRNQELYEYLQNLTETNIPGWGKKLTDKYPSKNRDQILTEMVDLIRAGTNGYAIDKNLPPNYEYAPARGLSDAVSGETQIVPLVPPASTPGDGTKGFGRFPTVTEAALVFYATESKDNKVGSPAKKMRALLILQPFSPTAGSWTWSPLVRYVVKGLDSLLIADKTGVFKPTLTNLLTARCGYGSGGEHNTPYCGTYAAFRHWNSESKLDPKQTGSPDGTKAIPDSGSQTGDEERQYNFVSDVIDVDPSQPNFKFGNPALPPAQVTVEVHSGYATSATDETLIQTLKFEFPAAPLGWPVPTDTGNDKNYNNRIGTGKFNLIHADSPGNGCDTVRSIQVKPDGHSKGDLRIIAALKAVPPSYFAPYPGGADGPAYIDAAANLQAPANVRVIHSLRNGEGGGPAQTKFYANLLNGLSGSPQKSPGYPIAARGTNGAEIQSGVLGDFDNGPEWHQDGAYINKPDDYYGSGDNSAVEIVTPNRQVSSPVMFGSLPSGLDQSNPTSPAPWRTLLFCANPAAGKAHPGFATIRDHVFLDFFTMPIIEPYAISEPFSTAGKVNLNYQIAPFTYITRSTAVRGVLKSTRVMAIPNSSTDYKGSGVSTIFRKEIDRNQTLAAFEDRFGTASTGPYNGDKGMFRAASEICDMYLVPKGATLATVKGKWWNDYALTGDNSREFPYGHIYARVTTKSNTYTVHMRVQVLRKRSSSDPAVWDERLDQVASEYRGSSTVERYIDPGDTSLKDFAKDPKLSMDDYYKFRIVSTKKFAP